MSVGDIKSVSGTSISLNNQPGQGTQKPSPSSKTGPDAPPKPADGPVAMPK
jgi:hypothetical protein